MFSYYVYLEYCYIFGICYKFGDFDGNNLCSICDLFVDKIVWLLNIGRFFFIYYICIRIFEKFFMCNIYIY